MRIITAWFRDIGDGLKFNHFSEGYDPLNIDTPPAADANQKKLWRNGIWIGRPGHLTHDVPPQLVLADAEPARAPTAVASVNHRSPQ